MNTPLIDVFADDAFGVVSLTNTINEIDHIPGRAGALAFVGTSEGISTTDAVIEMQDDALSIIPTSVRGAPPPKLSPASPRKMLKLTVPHIPLEETINADSLQNVRAFGTNELVSPEAEVNKRLLRMARRLDLTLEHHRLGALCGRITDKDGSVLNDLFIEFDILNSQGQHAPEEFEFPLDDYSASTVDNAVRVVCQRIARFMRRKAKAVLPPNAKIWAFCGDEFFDKFVSHPSVKEAYDGYEAARKALGEGFAFGVFEFGDVFFENYQGTDDNTTVAIAPDECRFFFSGTPELYSENYAPANFMEAVNSPGLPRYAKLAPDARFNQFVELHVQSNPLPFCLRPQTLCKGVVGETPST